MNTIDQTKPKQDWEILVSEGHVIGHRAQHFLRRWSLVSVGVYIAAAVALFLIASEVLFHASRFMPSIPVVGSVVQWLHRPDYNKANYDGLQVGQHFPQWVYNTLSPDPATYLDLGNGQRAAYNMGYLKEFPRGEGMKPETFAALVKAVRLDLKTNKLDRDKWDKTPALAVAPFATSFVKAKKNLDKITEGGLIVFPKDGDNSYTARVRIFARVGGVLDLVEISTDGGICTEIGGDTFRKPTPENICQTGTIEGRFSGAVAPIAEMFKD